MKNASVLRDIPRWVCPLVSSLGGPRSSLDGPRNSHGGPRSG